MSQERPLSGLLIAVLLINVALLVSVLLEHAQASGTTRSAWVQMSLVGVAVLLLARALKVSSELRSQVRRLLDINRLLS